MLFPTPPLYRKHSGRFKDSKAAPPPPVTPLVLTAAFYDWDELILILTFDRAVDISALVGTAIVVNDEQHNDARFAATGAVQQLSGEILQIGLELIGDSTGIGVFLNAAGNNGIVAVDDGGAWAGAGELVLPFAA